MSDDREENSPSSDEHDESGEAPGFSVEALFNRVVHPKTWFRDAMAVLLGSVLGIVLLALTLALAFWIFEPKGVVGKVATFIGAWLGGYFVMMLAMSASSSGEKFKDDS